MSHKDSYGLTSPFTTIALFGANGQIGDRILNALLSNKRHEFKVVAFIPPGSQLESGKSSKNVTVKDFDLNKLEREQLASDLKGVDAVVSALNGKALEAQPIIQDAAADVGVQRFYPSEYGMHHIYRKPGDPMGYVHPAWNIKEQYNELAVIHPAVRSGKMTFTMIGCGDFYNQDREKIWCPWTQAPDQVGDHYTIHVLLDGGAQADYTHLDDFAAFLVGTLLEPEKSKDQYLNVVSDTISHNEIASLLEKYSGTKVKVEIIGEDDWHKVIDNPDAAPKELTESAFPVDFWYLVKGTQGQGKFVRPKSQIHNGLFQDVQQTTFEKYFKERFSGSGPLKL